MHGLGDSIHQRAVLRQLMPTREIWLETSWPSVYWDMPELHLKRKPVNLRTQRKNAIREDALYSGKDFPRGATDRMRIAYSGADVRESASKTVLEAMCRNTQTDYATADYRLPTKPEWFNELDYFFPELRTDKPILVYRPLCERPEWRGGGLRNPLPPTYIQLFAFLREHFYVVSLADFEAGKEWPVGPQLIKPDKTLHGGELSFGAMAALFDAAECVFTASGFPAILAPAVGTACVNVVGGYELPQCHDSGRRFAPLLTIGTTEPCECWISSCNRPCGKHTDMSRAVADLSAFCDDNWGHMIQIIPRKGDPAEMFDLHPVHSGKPQVDLRQLALLRPQGLKA
jgi:hypothetical protein